MASSREQQVAQAVGVIEIAGEVAVARLVAGQYGAPTGLRLDDRFGGVKAAAHGIGNTFAGNGIDQPGGIAAEQDIAAPGRLPVIAEGQVVALDPALRNGAEARHEKFAEHLFQLGVLRLQPADADRERVLLREYPAIAPAGQAEMNFRVIDTLRVKFDKKERARAVREARYATSWVYEIIKRLAPQGEAHRA